MGYRIDSLLNVWLDDVMSDLNVYELPLGDITLERMDISNNKHIEASQGMRDIQTK